MTKIVDYHSFSEPDNVVITHSDLFLEIDFSQKIISGKVSHKIENKTKAKKIILDIRDIIIEKVTLNQNEKDTIYNIGKEKPFLGNSLTIDITTTTQTVNIYYKTSPSAAAVQWLEPLQTTNKKLPFMFTQSEAILARTWVPCQDSPRVRFTYSASIKVPKGFLVLMSAENNAIELKDNGIYHFKQSLPIPSYLLALAVGDIKYHKLGKHTGVYAESEILEKSVYEFADVEKMLSSAEKLYGKYCWKRFDVLVLPSSFPFGGMENPALTFATPTIIAGDRSLVSLVAHELAHSWSGNLVTNATWDDFWLNEGFTVYFERRIMEMIEDKSYSEMLTLLGYQDLLATIETLGKDNEDTKLKLKLKDRDADDGMTLIAYEKGFFLLLLIEQTVGRVKFDKFLNKYFEEFAFRPMTTEIFIEYINKELLNKKELAEKVNLDSWIYQKALPKHCPVVKSERFEIVDNAIKLFSDKKDIKAVEKISNKKWTTHEWLHFLRNLPTKLTVDDMQILDKAFKFTNSGNCEILCVWFTKAIETNYSKAFEAMENFLMSVGRRKFLLPIYKALIKTKENKKLAVKIYAKARPGYHYVSTNTLDELVGK